MELEQVGQETPHSQDLQSKATKVGCRRFEGGDEGSISRGSEHLPSVCQLLM